ncbi:MAG: hypothetical protein ACM31L_11250 [Actinomycetota bacterium]
MPVGRPSHDEAADPDFYLVAQVIGGVVADIEPAALAGASSWTLRLVVEDQKGRLREARYSLKLE